jgi:hypothetical protein
VRRVGKEKKKKNMFGPKWPNFLNEISKPVRRTFYPTPQQLSPHPQQIMKNTNFNPFQKYTPSPPSYFLELKIVDKISGNRRKSF